MFIERRASPRQPVVQNVEAALFCGDRQLSGRIADISEEGVRVILAESDAPLPTSLAPGMRLSLLVKSGHQAFECEIRRVGSDDLGLFFLDLASSARRRELIAKIAG